MVYTRLGGRGFLWLSALGVLGFLCMLMARLLKVEPKQEGNNIDVELEQRRGEGTLKLLQMFKHSYVHLSHRITQESLLNKISLIRNDGPQNLIVVSDFDLTLTKYWVNGRHGLTSYRVVDCSLAMPEAFRKEALLLRDKYAPIEHNQDLPLEERAQAMEDWTLLATKLLVKYKLNKYTIPAIVADADVQLRSDYTSFAELLSANYTPLLIFSAGLWDTIIEILQQQGQMSDNVHIVSNRLHFNEEGTSVGFEEPIIHSYKKGSIPEHFVSILNSIEGRHNVVLLGDSLSDTRMTTGLERVDHVIKIGFLNHDEVELLPSYKDRFDVVLTGDPGLEVPLSILEAILN